MATDQRQVFQVKSRVAETTSRRMQTGECSYVHVELCLVSPQETTMIRSVCTNAFRIQLPVAFTIAALAILSAPAQAADPDEITISAPHVRVVGRDLGTGAPIEETTREARIAVDPATLTTNSGVALLNDRVRVAAVKICNSIDPLMEDDGTCVKAAVRSAQAQVNAVIAQARTSANG
jgi:UrcA family protein